MSDYFSNYHKLHAGATARFEPSTSTIHVAGNLDTETASDFFDGAIEVLSDQKSGSRLSLMLGDVEYISSAGVGALARLLAEAEKRQIVLTVRSLKPMVRDVFSVLGLLRYFSPPEMDAASTSQQQSSASM
jgi:anti-anti-sigma factor